ncbi:hypothetical protein C2E23DRAFT_595652 [Lenzites betulinus]|nr:hypothetical protein C2E23DRAFT_595652 [Lenzites betulinus]
MGLTGMPQRSGVRTAVGGYIMRGGQPLAPGRSLSSPTSIPPASLRRSLPTLFCRPLEASSSPAHRYLDLEAAISGGSPSHGFASDATILEAPLLSAVDTSFDVEALGMCHEADATARRRPSHDATSDVRLLSDSESASSLKMDISRRAKRCARSRRVASLKLAPASVVAWHQHRQG